MWMGDNDYKIFNSSSKKTISMKLAIIMKLDTVSNFWKSNFNGDILHGPMEIIPNTTIRFPCN